MRRLLLALFLLAAGLLLLGCGGGGDTTAVSSTTGAAPSGAPAAPSAPSSSKGESVEGIVKPAKFKIAPDTPADLKKVLKAKRVAVVEFFMTGDPVTTDVAKQIAPLKKLFKKHVSFLSYDVSKAGKSGSISEQLKAGYSPYFLIIDKEGYVVYRHSGFIDRMTLEQQIFSTLRR